MKRFKSWNYLISILLLFAIFGCETETPSLYPINIEDIEIPGSIDTVKINYDRFFETRYAAHYPFVKVQDEFFFFTTYYLQIIKYNVSRDKWSANFTYNTEDFQSLDKYFYAAGDSIVMALYNIRERKIWLDIYSVDKETLSLRLLKKEAVLPVDLINEMHFFSFLYNNKIVIVVTEQRKIFVVDLKTSSVSTISSNAELSFYRSDFSYAVIKGQVNNNAYLYYYTFKKFFKFNLDTYLFYEIPVPKYLSNRMNALWDKGGMIDNMFCFWPVDDINTFCYDVENDKWLIEKRNPFYKKPYVPLYYFQNSNCSFYLEGNYINNYMIKMSVKK